MRRPEKDSDKMPQTLQRKEHVPSLPHPAASGTALSPEQLAKIERRLMRFCSRELEMPEDEAREWTRLSLEAIEHPA